MYNNITQEIYYSLITEIPRNNTNIDHKTNNALMRPIDVITSFYKNKMNGYTGSLRAFSLSNNFLWEFGYENGKRKFEKWIKTSSSNRTAKNPFPVKSSSVGSNSNTSIVCSDYYFITWYESGRITAEYIGTTCVTEDCPPATLGLRQDSLSINQGTLKINSTCAGIPEDGSPGGGGAAPEYVEIINNIKDPCLKALVTNLQNSGRLDNAIGKILLNVFGKNDKINLKFTQDDNLKSNDGKDDYGQTEKVSDGVYKIALNARLLSGFSQERQTLTIMHEILHGYLAYDNDVNLNLSIPNQHTKMLNNYIDQMASSLENIFPNLKSTPGLALALCFDNLESSVARSEGIYFNKISLNDFIDVLKNKGFDNISSYQSFANKAKSSDSPLGTPCSN